MKTIAILTALLAALCSPASAQQQVDPAFLQRALTVMQAQRNQAMDALAVADAKLALMADDLAKANEKIKESQAPKPDDEKKK